MITAGNTADSTADTEATVEQQSTNLLNDTCLLTVIYKKCKQLYLLYKQLCYVNKNSLFADSKQSHLLLLKYGRKNE